MNGIQLDLFNDMVHDNPLKGKRVCLCGSFHMATKEMNAKLKALGVTDIDRVSDTKVYKDGESVPPAKETTDFFVIGTNPHEACLKRFDLNVHDGFHARQITESKLYELMKGVYTEEDAMPAKVTKHLDLDYSYYHWSAPVINGKSFTSRTASPLQYQKNNVQNPLIEKEIYIPEIEGVNMNVLRQIVGNIGAYANMYMDANTYVIMLGDDTITKWKQGIKDATIKAIEDNYNQSDSKIFNICFTSVSDFLSWVQKRVDTNNDNYTKDLLDSIKGK